MADITKCANVECLSKELCYRHTAPNNIYSQSYYGFKATDKDDCEYYIDNKEED